MKGEGDHWKGPPLRRMMYFLPRQSMLFSESQIFETRDPERWKMAVEIANEYGYKVVKNETVK